MENTALKISMPKSKKHEKLSNGEGRVIKSREDKQEQFIIKDLFDGTYKVIALKSVKDRFIEWGTLENDVERKQEKQFEKELDDWLKECGWYEEKKENVSRETYAKLKESVSRSKRIIWEYARCNKWDYFVTLTLDEKKIDRKDLKSAVEKMGRMIWKINQSVNDTEEWGRQKKIEYVIVPELHKDGSVHFHGLMRGFHKSDIRLNEHNHIEWKHWRENFGFCNLQKIKNREKVCSYITKYICKETMETVKGKGLHTFYASHGLEKPYVIYKGYGEWKGEFDYVQEDGYCKTRICDINELDACFVPCGR